MIVTRCSFDNLTFGLIILLLNGVALFTIYAGEVTPFFKMISVIFLTTFGVLATYAARTFTICDRFIHLDDEEALSIDILEDIRAGKGKLK